MRNLLQKIIRSLIYLAASLVILLAVAVGLFRLLLPRLPEYQEEMKAWADAAIGMQVEFADMNARWRLRGPELTFHDAELTLHAAESSLLTAGEVSVGVSLLRLLRDRELIVDRIVIRDTHLTLQQSEDEGWLIQGIPFADIAGSRNTATGQTGDVVIVVDNIAIDYLLPNGDVDMSFVIDNLEISRDESRLVIDAVIDLPDRIGQRLYVSAAQHVDDPGTGTWQFFVEGKGISITGSSVLAAQLLPQFPQFQSGTLDLSASIQWSDAGIDHATADVVISDLMSAASVVLAPFDLQGRLEYSKDANGWLVSASNLVVSTVDGVWPRSTLNVDVGTTDDQEISSVSASASYLNLDDAKYIAEWLPQKLRLQVGEFDPSGVLRGLQLSLGDLRSERPRFSFSTELDEVGVAARDAMPGLRRLSGLIRTNNAGGRLEIDSPGLIVDLASQLAEPISFDDAAGTFIWRRNAQGTIILSDNILIRNADFDSQSSVQISLPPGGASPVIDLQSDWSINNIASVKRYLPAKLIKPGLYRWLNRALVAGKVTHGTTQLSGPLDKFPFDHGEGIFRVESQIENATLRYSDQWPDVQNMSVEIIVEGTHLYSHRNASINAGNSVVDARIEIPDLRLPILSIDAFATGSLASILEFSRRSPIAKVFGEHLADLSVDGDASFNLVLSYPIKDRESYNFSTRIQVSGGTLAFKGFGPTLTELNGIVNVSRDGVSSESLFGRFLGGQMDIDLRSAGDALPSYTVIAEATGRLSASGVIAEIAPSLEHIIDGSANYTASFYFPKAGVEQPQPFKIVIDSDLDGFSIDLPLPVGKPNDAAMPMSVSIDFPETGRINATGSLSDKLNWTLSFINKEDLGWDFDRGGLAVGGNYPEQPEIRGLRIVGNTETVNLNDWLALGGRGNGDGSSSSSSVADRIRSIDLVVGNFGVMGQNFKNHRFELHRSAEDWLVQVSGEQASGSVIVPYDFQSGRPLVVDMQTLILPGADHVPTDAAANEDLTDPRKLPPLSISVKNFAIGTRFIGQLDAEFAITERGLESVSLLSRDSSFSVEGSAGWIVNAADLSDQTTYVKAKLLSTDVEATMSRLDFEPAIEADDMEIDLDLSWTGGPREDFLASLDGNVALRLGSGQLNDIEPGAGRVFGLLSVVELPRRLSLDFRDVFDKGFGFDKITSTFHIVKGEAYTCDLSLEGPAAAVGIVGRTGLVARDYEQTAIVAVNVGNTLPVVGAVVAGPAVGAGLFLFAQIFKKPLRGVGQIYYSIDGSWDTPDISTAKAARFEANSGIAGCVDDVQ